MTAEDLRENPSWLALEERHEIEAMRFGIWMAGQQQFMSDLGFFAACVTVFGVCVLVLL